MNKAWPSRIIGAILLLVLAGAAHAALTPGQVDELRTALASPTPDEAALALRPLFNEEGAPVVELAAEAAGIEPRYCAVIMREGAEAEPDLITEIAAAIVERAPECEAEITALLAELLEAAAGPEGGLAPGAGGPGFPGPSPITTVSTTAENASQSAASPATP